MSDPTLSAPSSRRISPHSGQPSVQHPSRIEKPRSHHSSPRLLERRKTTTETKLYATLDDHFRMMFGMSPEDAPQERPQPSRPVSWHPSSSQLQASRPAIYFEPVPQHSSWPEQPSPSRQSNYSSDFFSLSTRNSMYGSMANVPNYTTALNTPVSEPLPWYLQQWAQKNQAQVMLDPHVRSPEWLPVQGHAEQEEAAEEDAGEGLVALGLYDVPEPSPIWDTTLEGTGKGLKLEETWQPPAQDDDGVAEEDGEEDSSEASVEEPSPPLPPTNALCPYPYMQMPVHGKSQPSGSMQGPSVFLGGDESVSNEWWFQSLQPVTMPVRDRGLGYGWL